MQKTSHILPLLLTVFIAALIVWSGINPSDRAVWYAAVGSFHIAFYALMWLACAALAYTCYRRIINGLKAT